MSGESEAPLHVGVAGLGFGLGFSHGRTPRPLISAAETAGFPLFEVPYPVPFIAITEAIFTRILAEQYDTLHRAVDAEHVLTRSVLEGKGVDGIAGSLADVTRGWALLLDLHGSSAFALEQPVATLLAGPQRRCPPRPDVDPPHH